MFTNKNLCANAKCVGEILNFFSALLTVFFLPILPCNTFVTHAVAMRRPYDCTAAKRMFFS